VKGEEAVKIRALIVDDESLARDEISFLLRDEEDIDIIGEAAGGEDAVRQVLEKRPDLIFLDIQMPVMDGFQVVRSLLRADALPLVVFTTAYDQYAIRAFEVNALDYLLKPIEKNRLRTALGRVREALPRRGEFVERVRKLAEEIKVGTPFLPRIVLRKGKKLDLYEVEKVAMLHKEGTAIKAHTEEGDFITNYTDMDELEVQLDPVVFIRLGGEYLVNLRKISRIVPWSGGKYLLVLDDAAKTEVPLNRSQAQLLKNKVEGIL
jgi:DNA-binding LytR/AlgR family response regulator